MKGYQARSLSSFSLEYHLPPLPAIKTGKLISFPRCHGVLSSFFFRGEKTTPLSRLPSACWYERTCTAGEGRALVGQVQTSLSLAFQPGPRRQRPNPAHRGPEACGAALVILCRLSLIPHCTLNPQRTELSYSHPVLSRDPSARSSEEAAKPPRLHLTSVSCTCSRFVCLPTRQRLWEGRCVLTPSSRALPTCCGICGFCGFCGKHYC